MDDAYKLLLYIVLLVALILFQLLHENKLKDKIKLLLAEKGLYVIEIKANYGAGRGPIFTVKYKNENGTLITNRCTVAYEGFSSKAKFFWEEPLG